MSAEARHNFDPNIFLSTIGDGRQMISFRKKQIIFAQGDATDAVFVIQKGKQQEKPMSKHDTPTKPHRQSEVEKAHRLQCTHYGRFERTRTSSEAQN